jgi:O-acetyl-ADP-ribose deacetylase (regulator of RNase III)
MEQVFEIAAGRRIRLVEGDITRVQTDAMANAANSALAGGGGVDGAIHRAGGPEIMRELAALRQTIGRLPAGQAVATGAGRLPAKWVLHAVGPIYRDGRGGEPHALASCYRVCLELAEQHACRSISFPAISTGVYGYPAEEAARIATGEVIQFLRGRADLVEEVIFVQYGEAAFACYQRLLSEAMHGH